MMSERKRKQKWSLNPRGKDWSENSNKFGQKLMEKMGWSSGKGLGAKEDGMTEHIRVAYKNDTQGMGYKDRDDQWTEHESNFTELLNTLVGPKDTKETENGNELKVESLEMKSKVSKARVHYHKFTRGKDLSRYSGKDLANIFGKKSLEDLSKSPKVKEENVSEKENQEDKSFGVVTHYGGNMLDYFKNKLPNFKKSVSSCKNDESESDSERPSFGFGFTQKEEKVGGCENESKYVNNGDKKKKQKDCVDNFRKPCFGLGYDRYNGDESERKNDYSSFVKATEPTEKKVPLKFGITKYNGDKNIEDNPSENKKSVVELGYNSSNNKKNLFTNFVSGGVQESDLKEQVNGGDTKKDKKRKKKNDTSSIDEDEETNKIKKIKTDINEDEVMLKEKKKEKNSKPSFVSFITNRNESVDDEKKKTKKSKNKILDPIVPENNNDFDNEIANNSPQMKKKKKDKKNRKESDNEEKNIVEENEETNKAEKTEINGSGISQINNDEVGLKKKKKEKKIKPSFVSFIKDDNESVDDKKKKSKKEVTDPLATNHISDFNNEVGDVNQQIKKKKNKNVQEGNDVISNIVDENAPVKKGKKRKSESEIDVAFTPVKKKFRNFEDLHSLQDEAKIVQTPDKESKKNKHKKKTKNEDGKNGLTNPAFDPLHNEIIVEKHHLDAIVEEAENSPDGPAVEEKKEEELENSTGVKKKQKKNKNKMNEIYQDSDTSKSEQNKNKKKKNRQLMSIENPCFNMDDSNASETCPNEYEVKRSKKEKNLGIVNQGLDLTSPTAADNGGSTSVAEDLPVFDDSLMLNVVCTPIIKKDDRKLQRRKSVRFSNTNESIFINKTDSPADLRKNGRGGLDNAAYDQFGNRIEENIDTLSKQLDDYQAEVENDLNEAKMQVMVGEVGDAEGENEILPSGEVKLKFKYANFGRMPPWMKKANIGNPKSSYRHLIRGDIVLGFKNTNMHDIRGYGEHLKASCT